MAREKKAQFASLIKKRFKTQINYKEEAIEVFTKDFYNNKEINEKFKVMYENGDIPLSFKQMYRIYFYKKGHIVSASYSYIKQTQNEFGEAYTSSYSGYIDDDFEVFDSMLYKNDLFCDNKLLYPLEDYNDFLNEDAIFTNQKTKEEFNQEIEYQVISHIKDKLYNHHSIKEYSTTEKIEVYPISDYTVEDEYIIIEPIFEISFDFNENKKIKTYRNYISLVRKKTIMPMQLPYSSDFKEFMEQNKPGFFSKNKLKGETLVQYLKEKYRVSLLHKDELNKYNEAQTISTALEYLKNKELDKGMEYIDKAFYLYNSKKVTPCYASLAKHYLAHDNFNYFMGMYYLKLVKNIDADAMFLYASLINKGLIKDKDYLVDSINAYQSAAKMGSNEAALKLYYVFKSPRFYNEHLAVKYLKLAIKYKNETAMKIAGM